MDTTSDTPLVVLGVTGCIAAYKACELARTLMREGCRVRVVMTEAATHFVGPATFRALTGEPVAVGLWDEATARVHHISLAEEADVFVVAPATANTLVKLSVGRADDLLSTTALATEAPMVLAPAMNVHMWRAEATRAAVATLRSRGAVVVEPETGELACGEVGEGRLAALDAIAEAVLAEVRRVRDLLGVRVLVTAGGTQEPIDPFGITTIRVQTAAQMHAAVLAAYADADAVVASAAVADFRPASAAERKQKKDTAPLTLELERTVDILAELGRSKGERLLVGFGAETTDVLAGATAKLASKNLDLVIANDVSEAGLGFGSDSNRVWFVSADETIELPVLTKTAIARKLWDRIAREAREAASRRGHGKD